MRRLSLLLAALVLGGCGLVPLPEQTFRDLEIYSAIEDPPPAMVQYMGENQLEFLEIPRLPYRNVEMSAVATYEGASRRLRVELFILPRRPDCPVIVPPGPGYTGALACDGPAGGKVVGEYVLSAGAPTPMRVFGPELDQAVQGGVLYLGVRMLEGRFAIDERITIRQGRVNGRL